jgi:hypothetical protein
MTTTLILIGIGLVFLVAVGAVLFSRARKVREGEAVSRAIAAIRKAEDPRIAVAANCKTEAPRFASALTRKSQAPIAAKAPVHRPEAPIVAEPREKKPLRKFGDVMAAEAARPFYLHPVIVGTVVKVDGQRVEIRGLGKLGKMELLEFPNGIKGVVCDSSEDKVEALLFGEYQTIKEGDLVKRGDSLNDGTAIKKASSEWRSNSYLSGSPDRSDSGGRL